MGNGNTGLKGQFGVGDPKTPGQADAQATGSDKQAQDFQAAFQQEQGLVNGHLQYTAVNAEASRHDPLAARRDAMFGAFQSALAKIDRNDPAKGQGGIDKVLGDARALSGEVAAFRQQAEKAKADWDSRQGKYDDAVRQVEELEAWEDAKAPALRGLVDGIRKQVNQRQYAQSTKTLDQLLPKLVPIYEEYLRQKEAKPQYEQQMAEESARLDPLKAAERPSQPMTAKAGEADAALQEAKGKGDAKDFVAGLESLAKVKAIVDELDTLTNDPQRQQYLTDPQAAEQISEPQPEPAFNALQADWTAISEGATQAQPLADSGDYAGANQALADAKAKRVEFQRKHDELVQQKKSYEDMLAQVQPRLQAASLSEPQYAKLQPLQAELATTQTQMESSAEAEDFGQALTQAQDLTAKVDAIEQAKAEIDQKKQEYESGLAALQPRLQAVSVSDPAYAKIEPQLQEITQAQTTMEASAQGGDFDQANTQLQDLTAKLDAYEQAKAEIDQKKQEYESGLAALQPRLQAVSVSDPAYAKIEPQLQEITQAQTTMEASAQGGDFDQANTQLQDLTAKLDAYEQAKAEIDQKKQEYESGLAALQPRLQAVSVSDPAYAKIEPQLQEITQAQTTMEASAQGGDYDQANTQLQDLTAKLDAYEQAKAEIDQKKQEYESGLAALQPRLQAVSVSDPAYAKIEPQLQEITQAQTTMEASAQGGDYDQANTQLQDLTAKLDAYEQAKAEIDQKKQEYESGLAALQPRLQAVSVSDPAYAKIEPQLQEITQAQTTMEASAQGGDYDQANTQLQDLTAKVDAYEQAKTEIDQKKQEYETAMAALQPRLDAASKADDPQLNPLQIELTNLNGQMKTSADAQDYGKAIEHANTLKTKLDEFEKAKQDLEAKKAEYEAALKALQPKLPTACPVNAKLSALDGEITTLKGQMEAAATSKDYAKALEVAKQVSAKADEFQKALAEFEKNKQDYEAAVKTLQAKLPTTCPVNASLAERHSQIMALKSQMEAAANSQDYAKALELAKQLSAKTDEYQKAVKETPPSPEKVKEVQDLIAAGKKEEALQKAMENYGVDKSQAKTIVYDSTVSGEAVTSKDGKVKVGDDAFSSPGWLASSAAHETEVHVNKQGKASKWYTGTMGTAIQEVQAYDHEIANAHKYNLTEAEIKELKKRRKEHYDQLNDDYKKRADGGNYDMKSGEEAQ